MNKPFSLLILFFVFTGCLKNTNKKISPEAFFSDDFTYVLKINDLNYFKENLKDDISISQKTKENLKELSEFYNNKTFNNAIYLGFKKNNDFLFSTEIDSSFVLNNNQPLFQNKENTIIEEIINENTYYTKYTNNILLSSNNKHILEQATVGDKSKFSTLLKSTDNNHLYTIAENNQTTEPVFELLFNANTLLNNHISVDISKKEDELIFNGLMTYNDSLRSILDCFKNTLPQKVNSINAIPKNVNSVLSFNYDNFSKLKTNLKSVFNKEVSNWEVLNQSTEICKADDLLIINVLDIDLLKDSISEDEFTESFREVSIYSLNEGSKSQLKNFELLNTNKNYSFYFTHNNLFVFGESITRLKNVISDIQNKKTLANSFVFSEVNKKMSTQSSVFAFYNSTEIENKTKSKAYNAAAFQFINENEFSYFNGAFINAKKSKSTKGVSELFNIELDTDLITSPQTIYNHITKEKDIIAQDINNKLYLISNKGKIKWTKSLSSTILGKVNQIDLYNNNKLQLAFTTENRIYVIDILGNDVENFPKKLNEKITQPLSVFDYDNKKKYRLLITQGKNLTMFNKKGKKVSGFKYKSNLEDIKSQPKHFKINNKDYIVFATKNHLKILNRRGKDRIKIEEKIRFSDYNIFKYNNKFSTTNTAGQLIQYNHKGKKNSKTLNIPDKHKSAATNKTLVTLADNILNIKSNPKITLDFGDYTNPRIFYLNDKIYVSTTDKQSRKVYLFDSQSKSIPNFPVFGTESATLDQLDSNRDLELITQTDSKHIIVYKIK